VSLGALTPASTLMDLAMTGESLFLTETVPFITLYLVLVLSSVLETILK